MSTPITQHEGRKYLRSIVSAIDNENFVQIDVYAVLVAFNVTCPATAHCIKKLLCAGERGKGSKVSDLIGAQAALNRTIELEMHRSQFLSEESEEK